MNTILLRNDDKDYRDDDSSSDKNDHEQKQCEEQPQGQTAAPPALLRLLAKITFRRERKPATASHELDHRICQVSSEFQAYLQIKRLAVRHIVVSAAPDTAVLVDPLEQKQRGQRLPAKLRGNAVSFGLKESLKAEADNPFKGSATR